MITETRQIHLGIPSQRLMVQSLLEEAGIRLDDKLDFYVGVFDPSDTLLGGAGLCGDVIKCVAVSESARDLGVTNTLVSRLRQEASSRGMRHLTLFTKPENESVFTSLAFHMVGRSDKAILMESDPRGISGYADTLRAMATEGRNGVIVMNCNPFTLGHKYLIETAAGRVDHLYVIPVGEDRSLYTYSERVRMIEAGCRDIENVIVCPGSRYAVSASTFPSYFLKRIEDTTDVSIALDLDIFARHIAPALGASVRFVGTEPCDMLTSRYNELMKSILPARGIVVEEIERMNADDGKPVSASRVRKAIAEGGMLDAARMLPSSSLPVLLAKEAAAALRAELHSTPKPGLVDEADNGAHADMDITLMERSIDAITPFFERIMENAQASAETLQQIGREAEEAMLVETGGVNTHKGAIFAMSLALVAFKRLCDAGVSVTSDSLSCEISMVAQSISRPEGTHGAATYKRYSSPGALDNARTGYRQLFDSWLPFLRNNLSHPSCHLLTLLKIMSEISDSNVLHRAGPDGACFVRQEACHLLDNFSISAMESANKRFIERNISPGGAADMLALTLLINKITS